MIARFIVAHLTALSTAAAFAVAASIFIAVAWRAIRMRTPQIDHMAQLPFETPTPACTHESPDHNDHR